MISRDWQCNNKACRHQFHSFDKANPPCPECGCVRVSWVPGGGHMLKVAPGADRDLRNIAAQHGMTNLNSVSHSRINRAAPRIETPPLTPELGVKHWGLGITSQFSAHGAVCVEASNPVNLRAKTAMVGPNAVPSSQSASIPGPAANAILEGRTVRRTIG